MRRLGRGALIGLVALLVAGLTAWGALFLACSNLPGAPLRVTLAAALALGTPAAFLLVKRRRRVLAAFAAVCAALLVWYFALPPSNGRQWEPPVAVLATATVNGSLVEVKNVRNFDYRSVTDYTPRYYDKTFDLDKLQSADLLFVHWGMPAIAHVMASFGFGGDDFVTFSIEPRHEEGEAPSTLRSFFRNYELVYVVADERDAIRVRSNYRSPREDVHIYRTRLPIEYQRLLFLEYVEKINELAQRPRWYNTIVDNCMTGVLVHTHAYPHRNRYSWKMLLSGYAAEEAYELRMVDTSIPFAELRQRSMVSARAQAADQAPDFSTRIREGIPMPAPLTVERFLAGE